MVCLLSENEIVSCDAFWISSSVSWFWSDGADTRAARWRKLSNIKIHKTAVVLGLINMA